MAGAYGQIPNIPDRARVDPGASMGKSISFAQEHLSDAADLGMGVSEAEQDILEKIMSRVPGLNELREGVPSAISSMISGDLSNVAEQISRSMAGVGLMGGLGKGSQAIKNLTAQKLGISSLSMMQQGISAATSWLSASSDYMAKPFDIAKHTFIDAGKLHAADVDEADSAFQVALAQAEAAAMPDPAAASREQQRLMGVGQNQFSTSGMGLASRMAGGNAGGSWASRGNTFNNPYRFSGAGNMMSGAPTYSTPVQRWNEPSEPYQPVNWGEDYNPVIGTGYSPQGGHMPEYSDPPANFNRNNAYA